MGSSEKLEIKENWHWLELDGKWKQVRVTLYKNILIVDKKPVNISSFMALSTVL